ncbi:MAG: acyltransferase family protein [Oscillospiraceae bacterium]|nr:acyltransferase family protein [Oscillospiraceae bacterium]
MEIIQGQRKEYLDIAKGIGILLVVLGHCPLVYHPLKQWIYSFHMPLFFFIGGMVWNKASHEKRGFFTWKFLMDKAKRLLIPCFLWALFYSLAVAVMNGRFSPKVIAYLLYGSQAGFQRAGSLTSLWFLPCMFLSVCAFEIVQQLLSNAKRRELYLLCVSVFLAAVGLFLPRFSRGYPWSIDIAFLAAAFMIWGCLAAKGFEAVAHKKVFSLLLFLLVLAVSLTYVFNLPYTSTNNVDLAGRHFGNRALYLLDAAAGSACILLLGTILRKSKAAAKTLGYLGRITIPILIVHKPLVRALSRIGGKLGVPDVITVILSVAAATGISILVYLIVKRILPIVFGESRQKVVPQAAGK